MCNELTQQVQQPFLAGRAICLFGAFACVACQPPAPVQRCLAATDCTSDQRCDPVYGVCMPLPWDAARPDLSAPDAAARDAAAHDVAAHDVAEDAAGDPFAAWRWRVKLTFDNQAATEDLVDFPVLVVFDGVRLPWADLAANGADLRFVDADGVTLLAHEVESWDSTDRAFVWVRVPRIAAASSSDFIWLYYGNPAAASTAAPAAVWSNHFRAVYHLGESLRDSTGLAPPAIAHGTTTERARIGSGARFDGVSAWIELGPNLTAVQAIGGCTISLWLRPTTVASASSRYLVSYSTSSVGNYSRASLALLGDGEFEVWGRSIDSEAAQSHITSGVTVASDSWSHLVGTVDYPADTVGAFFDGTPAGQTTVAFASDTTPHTASANSALGSEDDGIDCYYGGAMDEVRLSDVVRSASWNEAEYRSGRDDFIVYGTPEAH